MVLDKKNDTVIFMTSFILHNIPKKSIFNKKRNIHKLLKKYHIESLFFSDTIVTQHGKAKINKEYDHVKKDTIFNFNLAGDSNSSKIQEDIDKMGWFFELMHSKNILLDENHFNLNIGLNHERFLVTIDSKSYQVDPLVYFLNDVLYITFELIDFKTGLPLQRDNLIGKYRHFNILPIDSYSYFSNNKVILAKDNISNIIFNNLINFFKDFSGHKLHNSNNSWIHNISVLTYDNINIEEYFLNVLGLKDLSNARFNLNDISPQNEFKYYMSDGLGVNMVQNNKQNNNKTLILRDFQILESLKIYIFTKRLIYDYIIDNEKETIENHLWLKYIMNSSNMPVASINVINAIEQTKTFQRQDKAIDLKIKLLNIKNESKRNKNGFLLNILLYFLAIFTSIESAGFIEKRFGYPFKYTFGFIFIGFVGFGIYLIINENRNKT